MMHKLSVLVLLCLMVSVSAAADPVEKANVDACKRFYEEVANKGKIAVVDELLAEDFVDHEVFPGLEGNRDGVKNFFTMMRAAFPDLKFTVQFYLADGDMVAAYITMSGTHKGEFMGIAPTGKQISVQTVDIMRMKDGKAVEHWGVTDGMAMMEQLGALGSQ